MQRMMIRTRILALSFAAVASLTANAQERHIREATPAEVKAAKRAIGEHLKDPDSAKYSSVVVGLKSEDGVRVICGLVNAKNSYGGYSGDTWFYAALAGANKKEPVVVVLSLDGELAASMCRQKLFD